MYLCVPVHVCVRDCAWVRTGGTEDHCDKTPPYSRHVRHNYSPLEDTGPDHE